MFFEDHEKWIYSPESKPDLKFDPLAVDRDLNIFAKGHLTSLLEQWRPIPVAADGKPATGDVSADGITQSLIERKEAEAELVVIARKTFKLPEFPDCLDAEVLEVLTDYLWWMEKKGQRGETPPTSSTPTVGPVCPVLI